MIASTAGGGVTEKKPVGRRPGRQPGSTLGKKGAQKAVFKIEKVIRQPAFKELITQDVNPEHQAILP